MKSKLALIFILLPPLFLTGCLEQDSEGNVYSPMVDSVFPGVTSASDEKKREEEADFSFLPEYVPGSIGDEQKTSSLKNQAVVGDSINVLEPSFNCCEACPGTDADRFYIPLGGSECEPGDVKRTDLDRSSCANPIVVNPGPTTYGARCQK